MNQNSSSQAPLQASSGLGGAVLALCRGPLYWLLLALPVAGALEFLHAGGIGVFIASAIAIIPLAGLMGRATESLSESLSPAIGGLLNATFGNAAELIIALFALSKGPQLYPLVKASITGSIIGNVLLVLGVSIVAGGLRFPKQVFNRTAASMGATMLALASVGLVMPAIFFHVVRNQSADAVSRIESLSEEIAGVLAFIYILSLIFTLVTHRHLFSGEESGGQPNAREPPEWNWQTALALLVVATAAIAWMSDLLVGAVEEARAVLGMTEVFTGIIVVAVIGNAADRGADGHEKQDGRDGPDCGRQCHSSRVVRGARAGLRQHVDGTCASTRSAFQFAGNLDGRDFGRRVGAGLPGWRNALDGRGHDAGRLRDRGAGVL
jgi:calcium/proton exchanger cax